MLKTRNLAAYRDLLVLFTKYGRRDFRLSFDIDEMLMDESSEELIEPDVRKRAEAFASELLKLGPTYVKFGQVLSTRPDIVPPEYVSALESLQDDVEAFSFADVEKTVEEELGVRISKAFSEFDAKPLAAASLGQVHHAVLRDGRDVVVKVQRPNVREQVRAELEAFEDLAKMLEEHTDLGRRMNLVGAIEQVKITLYNELDYLQEAHNADILRRNLASFPQIYIPAVIRDFTTSRVLTTELVKGRKVSKLSPLSAVEQDFAPLAGVFTRAYLKQICVDGFWHADPHPGNIFVRDTGDGLQLVLIDFGMVNRISREFQDEIIKLLLAIASNRGVEAADACVRLSERGERFDLVKFTHDISVLIAKYHDIEVNRLNVGQLIFNVIALGTENDLRPPAEMALLAKTLLNLDGITRRLDPAYDPKRVMREYGESLIAQKLQQKFNPRNFYPALLDFNQFVHDLPHRAREIVDLTAAGRLTFGIKLTQAEEFLAGIHKIANRITVGVVIAALLVASSLMARIPTTWRILGYPGVAILGYAAALIAGLYLIVSTFLRDRDAEERAKFKGR